MFKPMLASHVDFSTLIFPKFASPKLDGVRAIVRDGVVYSRSNKPIPNKAVQELFSGASGWDGELIVGSPTSPTVYRDTVSTVMSRDKSAKDVTFYVFDHILTPTLAYRGRIFLILESQWALQPQTKLHVRRHLETLDQVLAYEEECVEAGYEGLILRDPDSPYKFGRSTAKEQIMLKVKRFLDAEARVIGFQERRHNGNSPTTNELGRSARSSHQENKTGRGGSGGAYLRLPRGHLQPRLRLHRLRPGGDLGKTTPLPEPIG